MTMLSRQRKQYTSIALSEKHIDALFDIHPKSIIRKKELSKLLDLSEGTIENRTKPGAPGYDKGFPKPKKLGPNSIGWIAGPIFDYIDNLPE